MTLRLQRGSFCNEHVRGGLGGLETAPKAFSANQSSRTQGETRILVGIAARTRWEVVFLTCVAFPKSAFGYEKYYVDVVILSSICRQEGRPTQ